jgi:hypothetical protein
MAQGEALAVLARAFQITASQRYATVARAAARGFLYDVSDGGLVTHDLAGNCFIEEIAVDPAIHVLNGCLFGFVGLFEYNQVFPDPAIADALKACERGIDRLLPAFDTGHWSRYSLGVRWNIATPFYHRVHIRQLEYLGHLLDRQSFLDRGRRFAAYEGSRLNRVRTNVRLPLQLNVNRALTVMHLPFLKYRKVPGWDQAI